MDVVAVLIYLFRMTIFSMLSKIALVLQLENFSSVVIP